MVALVSGGARGIGRGIVRTLAKAGANVVFGDHDGDGGRETVRLSHGSPGKVVFCEADFADPQAWPRLLEICHREGWTPTLGVSNVGIGRFAPVDQTSPESYAEVEAINQRSAFLMAGTLAPAMGKRGGALIFIGSIMSEFGTANYSLYGMTKQALVGLTRSLAVELAPRRITVNCIQPGFITIDPPSAIRKIVPPALWHDCFEAFRDRIEAAYESYQPLPVAGTPEDIAEAVLFLASKGARFITGSVLRVDGGAALSLTLPARYFPDSLFDDVHSWLATRQSSLKPANP